MKDIIKFNKKVCLKSYNDMNTELGTIQLLRSHSGGEGGVPQNANKSERGEGGGFLA